MSRIIIRHTVDFLIQMVRSKFKVAQRYLTLLSWVTIKAECEDLNIPCSRSTSFDLNPSKSCCEASPLTVYNVKKHSFLNSEEAFVELPSFALPSTEPRAVRLFLSIPQLRFLSPFHLLLRQKILSRSHL